MTSPIIYDSFKSTPELETGDLDAVHGYLVLLFLDTSLQGFDTVVSTLASPRLNERPD